LAPPGACPRAGPRPDPWAGVTIKIGSRQLSATGAPAVPSTGSRRSSSVTSST
jgi:hypothetical protein